MFHWLASMSVPFLSSPFVAKCKLSRVCRKGDDMRAFGETIGRHCRPNHGHHKYLLSCYSYLPAEIPNSMLVLLTSAATHLSQARSAFLRPFPN